MRAHNKVHDKVLDQGYLALALLLVLDPGVFF